MGTTFSLLLAAFLCAHDPIIRRSAEMIPVKLTMFLRAELTRLLFVGQST